VSKTQEQYAAAAQWAEQMDPSTLQGAPTHRGEAAATFGRRMLEEALGGEEELAKVLPGRPSIDPQAGPGRHARIRHVRLAESIDTALDEIAHRQNRTASEVLRDAIAQYLAVHRAG